MKDSFNSDFYITAATVIPLFYITLFLQGNLVQGLAKRVGDTWAVPASTIRSFLKSYILWPIANLIFVSAVAGIAAEALSLLALYHQSDNTVIRAIVLWSMLGLLALVGANPTIAIVRNMFRFDLPDDSADQQPSSEEEQQKENS